MGESSDHAYRAYTGMRAVALTASMYFVPKNFQYSLVPAVLGSLAAKKQILDAQRFSYMTTNELLIGAKNNDPRLAKLKNKII